MDRLGSLERLQIHPPHRVSTLTFQHLRTPVSKSPNGAPIIILAAATQRFLAGRWSMGSPSLVKVDLGSGRLPYIHGHRMVSG